MDGARKVTAVDRRSAGGKGHYAQSPPCRLRPLADFHFFNGRFVVPPRNFHTR